MQNIFDDSGLGRVADLILADTDPHTRAEALDAVERYLGVYSPDSDTVLNAVDQFFRK